MKLSGWTKCVICKPMNKALLSFLLLISCFVSKSQYSGYTLVNDISKFKDQFSSASQKTQTIKSDFVQEKNLSMLSEKITSKGKFWFKKDNLVRMEYSTPFQYLMIINKNNVYVKDGNKENKIATSSNKLFQQINKITVDCVGNCIEQH
jgi:outer membrane lipoprotein-sorting protein